MMSERARIAVVAFMLVAAACSAGASDDKRVDESDPNSDVGGGGDGEDSAAAAEAPDGTSDGSFSVDPDGGWPIIDGGGDCAVKNTPAYTACCEGVACSSGYCGRAPDGGTECSCFGVIGGCRDGTICCAPLQGCSLPGACIGF